MTAPTIGNSINVVAAFEIHMLKNADAAMNPKTSCGPPRLPPKA